MKHDILYFLALAILTLVGLYVIGMSALLLFLEALFGSRTSNNILTGIFLLAIASVLIWAVWYVFHFPFPHITFS